MRWAGDLDSRVRGNDKTQFAGRVYHMTSRGKRREHEIHSRLSGLTLYAGDLRREHPREQNVVM